MELQVILISLFILIFLLVSNTLNPLGAFRGWVVLYKWKNHFSEMKGDVGMSLHEKEGEQEDA